MRKPRAFRERNAGIRRDQGTATRPSTRRASATLELGTLEETRKHYQDSLMQVKNQREYAAVLKEIRRGESQHRRAQEAILASMDEVES